VFGTLLKVFETFFLKENLKHFFEFGLSSEVRGEVGMYLKAKYLQRPPDPFPLLVLCFLVGGKPIYINPGYLTTNPQTPGETAL
jgi:hypothetical protein